MKKKYLLAALIISSLVIVGILTGSMIFSIKKVTVTDDTRLNTTTDLSESKQIPNNSFPQEKVIETEGELVDGFPDIPIYPTLKIDKTYKKVLGGKTNYLGIWYYKGDIKIILDWYVIELKKAGWSVTGPFVQEGENDLEIDAENADYNLRLLNSEREKGDRYTPGEIITADLTQK